MNTFKKTLMVAAAVASLTLGALATTGAMPMADNHRDPAKMVDRMKEKLGLSDAQTTKIKTIFENNKAMLEADHNAVKSAANDDAKNVARQKMHADMEQVQSQVQPVLTQEQLAKWNEMKAKHEHKGEQNEQK